MNMIYHPLALIHEYLKYKMLGKNTTFSASIFYLSSLPSVMVLGLQFNNKERSKTFMYVTCLLCIASVFLCRSGQNIEYVAVFSSQLVWGHTGWNKRSLVKVRFVHIIYAIIICFLLINSSFKLHFSYLASF